MYNIDDLIFLYNSLQCRYKKALKKVDEYLDKARTMKYREDAIYWERKADSYYSLAMNLARHADNLKLYV